MLEGGASAAEIERLAADLEGDVETLDRLASDCLAQREVLAFDRSNRGAASILALGMHGYYTAVESALKRIDRLLVTPPQPSPTWHQELLWGATRPIGEARLVVITIETARHLDKLRGFRDFLRHAYGVDLDASELTRTAAHLESVHPRLRQEFKGFIELLAKLASRLRG